MILNHEVFWGRVKINFIIHDRYRKNFAPHTLLYKLKLKSKMECL